jgi:hypothetical protein
MTDIEALRWLSIILEMPQHEQTKIVRKFAEFYFTNPIRHAGCPFLSNGSCSIYEFSFLITSLIFGQIKTILGKFAVIKEIVRQGSDERLQAMLGKVLSF